MLRMRWTNIRNNNIDFNVIGEHVEFPFCSWFLGVKFHNFWGSTPKGMSIHVVNSFQPVAIQKIRGKLLKSWENPQNGWLKIMENPMNKWMIWGENPLFLETSIILQSVVVGSTNTSKQCYWLASLLGGEPQGIGMPAYTPSHRGSYLEAKNSKRRYDSPSFSQMWFFEAHWRLDKILSCCFHSNQEFSGFHSEH